MTYLTSAPRELDLKTTTTLWQLEDERGLLRCIYIPPEDAWRQTGLYVQKGFTAEPVPHWVTAA